MSNNEVDNELNRFTDFLLDKFEKSGISIHDILDGFPTVSQLDSTIKDPMYTRCFSMGDGENILGYSGSKDDILDMGYGYLLPEQEGVNLWILTYNLEKKQWLFSFVRTQNWSEIGTKHGMLLHQIQKERPNDLVILAGEVSYDGYRNLKWNISSGTVTTKIPSFNSYKLLALLFSKIFKDDSIKKLYGHFVLRKLVELSVIKLPFIKVRNSYELGSVSMLIVFMLLKPVFKTMFEEYKQQFDYPDLTFPASPNAIPNFLKGNQSLLAPLKEYAPSLCDKRVVRDNMYVYSEAELDKCNLQIEKQDEPINTRRLCKP
jgi:hypothetical protein